MDKNKLYIIAVDGPAGAGKSTVCSDVAKKLGILHLDTGATYRTFALVLIKKGIDASDSDAIKNILNDINISIEFENNTQIMYLDGVNVNGMIRTNEVSAAASACAVIPEVRLKMVDLQRQTAQKISKHQNHSLSRSKTVSASAFFLSFSLFFKAFRFFSFV